MRLTVVQFAYTEGTWECGPVCIQREPGSEVNCGPIWVYRGSLGVRFSCSDVASVQLPVHSKYPPTK